MGEKSSVPVRRQDIPAGQRGSPKDTADARQEGRRGAGWVLGPQASRLSPWSQMGFPPEWLL